MPNSQAVREPTGLEVAIVGASVRFPGASDLDAFWRLLREGTETISFFSAEETRASTLDPIPADDPQHVRAAGVVVGIEDFDAAFFAMSPREAEATDPQHRLFLECAWEALETAGYAPDLYAGRIGVYASAGTNTYLLNNLCANRTFLGMSNALQMIIGNDKDYLATRASYKLNLRGPSLMVQTACSSSLVAVHTACQALLDGDCDMALAGGASINVPQTAGYRYQEGSIGSPDGHCRPFDADACGTVKSSGAGVVLLKRLEDALTDGDTVLAVIRGSAVNNDGSAKVSFSAPSVEGQAEAIEAALRVSEVDPESITYIEAHGTGTRVGDPIEFAALERAFRGRRSEAVACAIGSVKSNLGHLDAAAGMAGLIKTALALRHREIPPSLHYRRPNPNIDFAATPFRVAAALESWPDQTGPRRAGVSSFGIGGTNCHVVLEEPPCVARAHVVRNVPQLLLLSARTRTALDRMSDRLATRLDGEPDETLADAAYTLQVGRTAFPWRRTFVATSTGEAVTSLRGGARTDAGLAAACPKIALLLPGQGTQRPGMAARLYEDDPRFRAFVDDCAARFAPFIDFDLRRVFRPKAEDERVIGDALARTSIAQPALFTIEYATTLLLKSWRITPDAMIGHSVGELVAACLADVFSLEDAVRIVAARGRLMQACPPGAMTAVRLAEAEVSSRLAPDLSLAAVNGAAMCVVSGSLIAIDRFEGDCRTLGVQTQRLPVSHAFHSMLMEPALPAFRDILTSVPLQAPKIPFISNVTGRLITDKEAMDSDYWVRQVRAPVRFHDGLCALVANEPWALVETGPGDVLSRLAKPCVSGRPDVSIHCCLAEKDDGAAILSTAGQLWCRGVDIDRARLSPAPRRRIPLPTYPFEKKRLWIDPDVYVAEAPARRASAPSPMILAAYDRADDEIASRGPEPGAPMTEMELFVAGLWCEALGVETVGPHDDFFALGGDSILGLQVTFRARQAGVAFSSVQLLQHSTVVALAREIERIGVVGEDGERGARPRRAPVDLPEIASDPSRLHEPFPLTDVQQAYWIGRSGLAGGGPIAAHVYQEYEGRGLDLARLESALDRLIARHDALRSVTTPDGRQKILAKVPRYKIVVSDLVRADPQAAQATLLSCREGMSHRVHPSDRWPLFEVRASLLPDDVVRLHLSIDILFTDAWSLVILGRELIRLYADPAGNPEPLKISFRDYVVALENLRDGDLFRESRRYWMARLTELPGPPALPLADSRAPTPPRFTRRSATLDAPKWNALKSRGKLAGLTPAMILCAAYAEILTIWSAAPRFCLNLPLFNRLPLHPDVNAVLGDFTSVVLLEVDNSGRDAFDARAKRLQRRLWDDLEHRHFNGVAVMRELARVDAARAFMPVVFTSLILPGGANSAGEAEAQFGKTVFSVSQTPQVWLDHQVAEEGDGLLFNWDSVDARFPADLVEDMFAAYCRLLDVLAEDPAAWTNTETCRRIVLPTTGGEEVAPVVGAISSSLLHEGFFRRAESDPDRPAVLTTGGALTYGELALRARQVARLIDDAGGAGRRVAIVMEKGWAQLAAVFGILWSGAAYVPIDPDVPIGYVHALLEEIGAACVLTQPSVAARLRWPNGMRVVEIDEASLAGVEPHMGTPVADAEALAYVIYTSGTTGRPKGVMIDHRGALNTICDINARFAVGASDRVLALSALNFDLSVYDIFGPLSVGAAVILPDPKAGSAPSHWLTLAARFGATIWNSVPALAVLLAETAEAAGGSMPPLRLVLLSGDWIPLSLPQRLTHRFQGARIISLGGATEASIWSILYEIGAVDPAWKSIPYGKALACQRVHVLDVNLDPRPVHVPGALFIGGDGLALGYWENAAETDHRFVVHPRTGERLYRTGDLGRLMPDGNIEFLGREDFQVKIHGHRIELGEIESALEGDPSIERAVVVVRASVSGAKTLVAYVVPKFIDDPPMSIEMRSFLEGQLPSYMVPSVFVVLRTLPLTANGKIDRQSLPEPEIDDEPHDILFPSTETERRLAAIWSHILEIASVAVDRNFFEIGGDSLLATRMMVVVQTELDVDVTLRTIFENPTIASLAGILDSLAGLSNRGSAIDRAPRVDALPVSAAQGRLWFADRLSPGDSTYNFSVALLLRGVLDTDVLARSLGEIVRRHEVLRTTFGEIDGVPVQIIGDRHDVSIWRNDASERRMTELDRKRFFETALNEEARFAFDLVQGPLFRARLLHFSSQDSILLLTMHHLVTDAWSMAILVEEVAALYAAFSAGAASPLPELTLQYADYAAWEQGEIVGAAMGRQLDYWMEVLSSGAPWLRLPEDHSGRPALPNNGARSAFRLSAASLAALKQLCVKQDATLFMGLLAIWQLLLHYYSRQKDILVGSPSANRDQAEIADLIGVFVNTLVMKAHFTSGAISFREVLAQVREAAIEAYANQRVPYDRVVDEFWRRRPFEARRGLFRVWFVLQNVPIAPPVLGDLAITPLEANSLMAVHDLKLSAVEDDDGLACAIDFRMHLFEPETIERMTRLFAFLVDDLAAEPGRSLDETNARLASLGDAAVKPPEVRPEAADLVGVRRSRRIVAE